jgi:hypothetical protein
VRLIGVTIWYDENPAWLAACVASMARAGISHVVAVDGAYALYPDGIRHPRSGLEQHAAVSEVCQAMQIGCTLHSPAEAYAGNEVEKRTLAFRLAEQVAEEDDWYFVMDADQTIVSSLGLREKLATTDLDVGEVLFYERGAGQEFNGERSLWPVRCLFRAIPGLAVVGKHYSYVTPDGRDLWGDPPLCEACPTGVEVEHRTRWRPRPRIMAHAQYAQRRDELGVERDRVASA